MKEASLNEKQLEKNKNDVYKSKGQTVKAKRENIYQRDKRWKRARMICKDSESRSHKPTW